MAKSEDFAQEGERFLTNSVIRPDDERSSSKEVFEKRMGLEYQGFVLRFDYEHLVYNFRQVTSEEFGCICSDLPRGQAIGVAVYGKKK